MTQEVAERRVHGLTIRIDATLCVSFGDCVDAAPEAFELDGQGIVTFVAPEKPERARLLEACAACPVDALAVCDADGRQLVP